MPRKNARRSPSLERSDSEVSVCPSNFEAWRRSETPPDWHIDEGDEEIAEWPVEGKVRQEIDLLGDVHDCVRWKDWRRSDGTNTTWQRGLDGMNELQEQWDKSEAKRKKALIAQNGTDIDLTVITKALPHDVHTAEDLEAYEEKIAVIAKQPATNLDWDQEIEMVKAQHSAKPGGKGKKRRRDESLEASASKTPSSSSSAHSRSKVRASQIISNPINRTSNAQASSSRADRLVQSSQGASLKHHNISILQASWNAACAKEHAAALSIQAADNIGNEKNLPVDPSFVYRESHFDYADGVPNPDATSEFMVGCDCGDVCTEACDCRQTTAEICGDEICLEAYDENGLFTFEYNVVNECNKLCNCAADCGNKVAQQPRNVHLELFRCRGKGWGVRSLEDLPVGKVLGLYTGSIMKEENVDKVDRLNYSFALDALDHDQLNQSYSVVAVKTGNWTRFVNHSCDPNAQVYSVIYDSIPEANIPYVVLVAKKPITAGTEITIDYNRYFADDKSGGKRKGPGKKVKCECGAKNCRGWL